LHASYFKRIAKFVYLGACIVDIKFFVYRVTQKIKDARKDIAQRQDDFLRRRRCGRSAWLADAGKGAGFDGRREWRDTAWDKAFGMEERRGVRLGRRGGTPCSGVGVLCRFRRLRSGLYTTLFAGRGLRFIEEVVEKSHEGISDPPR